LNNTSVNSGGPDVVGEGVIDADSAGVVLAGEAAAAEVPVAGDDEGGDSS